MPTTNSTRPALIADTMPMMDAIDRERSFSLVSAVHRPKVLDGTEQRSTWRTAVANYLYIMRETGSDMFGATPPIPAEKMDDVGQTGRRGPIGCDVPELVGVELWRKADEAAAVDRPELPAAFHAVGWLPLGLNEGGWRDLVLEFCDDVLVRNGMVADWAVHRRPDGEGSWIVPPHVHLIITARGWRPERNPGRRNLAWFGGAASVKAAEDAWKALLIEAADVTGASHGRFR